MQCINVSITDDSVFEESETFTVTVTTASPQVTLGNNHTTVIIMDNEGPCANLRMSMGIHAETRSISKPQ